MKSARAADRLIDDLHTAQNHATRGSAIRDLRRLGYLGFDNRHELVGERAEFLFSLQNKDGSWPLPREATGDGAEQEGYSMVPLQTALPLIALSACGYAEDPRSESGYEWLLSQRLDDGAWPTGRASGVHGRVAGYRKLPHSRWGCRTNTTGAIIALASHPERRSGAACRRGVDLLLSREKYETANLGFEVARGVGAEVERGFLTHFARSDPGLLLELGWRAGYSFDEPRMGELRQFVCGERTGSGIWHYSPKPQAGRWVSFFLLRTLLRDDTGGLTQSDEPPTPFQQYPRQERRW